MKKAYTFVIITAFLFGTMEVACKIGGSALDPFQLTFLRFVIGGLVLLPFAVADLRKKNMRPTPKDYLILAGVGTLGIPISMVLFQIAVNSCNASTVSVIFCVNPFFTMVFAHIFTSEKIDRRKLAVLAIALIGIVLMFRPWDIQAGNTAIGMLLMILAAVFFGLYTIAGKYSVSRMGLMAQTSISFLLGAFILLIFMIVVGKPVLAHVSESIPIILYTGILVTGLGYFCYFKAIELADAATGSFAFFLKPAIAPVIAVIVLKESILINTVLGIVFILAASLINIMSQKRNGSNTVEVNKEEGRDPQAGITCEDILNTFRNYEPVGERGFKHFAVLVPIVSGQSLKLIYEVRAQKLDRQPGEICFPGGLIEAGESPEECALRETEEELGISKESINIAGRLDSIHTVSGSEIHCFVGIVDEKAFSSISPSADEVAEVFTVELSELMNAKAEIYENNLIQEGSESFPYDRVTGGKPYPWRGGKVPVPVYDIEGRIIWGLTGRMTRQLIAILDKNRDGGANAGGKDV